jgi:hypothetical protein
MEKIEPRHKEWSVERSRRVGKRIGEVTDGDASVEADENGILMSVKKDGSKEVFNTETGAFDRALRTLDIDDILRSFTSDDCLCVGGKYVIGLGPSIIFATYISDSVCDACQAKCTSDNQPLAR